ncbi:MAG: hypothetical protein QOJ15_924 [Bradyrhizobium sp.]|jgi:hypothetical protein|nr:hypothetical protein [Bradyrhizobium sp.]
MTKFKLLAAAAVLSTVIAAPAMAEQIHHRNHAARDRGPVGAAADVAGAAIGTAGAIATAPFRNSYAYDRDRDYGPNGFACHRGEWVKGEDGRRHICQ